MLCPDAVAVLRKHLGSLDLIRNVIRVNGYRNGVLGFPDSPKVINGASDLWVEALGDAGQHVRGNWRLCLPHNASVELQITVEI